MRTNRTWVDEAELASAFMAVERSKGLKCYPEIDADILVKSDQGILAAEVKLHPNLKVLSQAWQHRNKYQYVGVVVPTVWRGGADYRFFVDVCEAMNIGMYTVQKSYPRSNPTTRELGPPTFSVTVVVQPVRKEVVTPQRTLMLLNEDAEKFTIPGCPSPSGFSHWHAKYLKLARYAHQNPGISLRDAWVVCFPPPLNRRTGKPCKIPRNDLEFAAYYLRSGKCRFLSCNAEHQLSVTNEFHVFEASTTLVQA